MDGLAPQSRIVQGSVSSFQNMLDPCAAAAWEFGSVAPARPLAEGMASVGM
jgi:hypothetical protein